MDLPEACLPEAPIYQEVIANCSWSTQQNGCSGEAVDGNCASCHDKLWPQTTEPLKNSQGCNTCHKPDGKAFSASDRSNCARCHPANADKTPKKP